MTKRPAVVDALIFALAALMIGVVGYHLLSARRAASPPAPAAGPAAAGPGGDGAAAEARAKADYRAVSSLPPIRVRRVTPSRKTTPVPAP